MRYLEGSGDKRARRDPGEKANQRHDPEPAREQGQRVPGELDPRDGIYQRADGEPDFVWHRQRTQRSDNKRAKTEAESAKGGDVRDIDSAQPPCRIDPVADGAAREKRQPDIVGKRVGHERGQRRRAVAQLGIDHHQAQNFVSGQRQVRQHRQSGRDQEIAPWGQLEPIHDLVKGMAAQLVAQRPQGRAEQAQGEQCP